MLLALTSAKRQSDLHALDLTFVQFLTEGVEFRIPGLTKTRTPGKDVVFFSHPLQTMFSCVQWPVSRNALRRQKSSAIIAVLVSLYF